ncbi:MAG: Panacea domain-containing protein [Chitinophagaceae bacterium]
MKFTLDIDKAVEASLYVLNKVEGACDFHRLFKILYFAEKEHLAAFGRPITGDQYVAMPNGPVPSFVYDALKTLRGGKQYLTINYPVADVFEVVDWKYAGAKRAAKLEYLSESDLQMLHASIKENGGMDFETLTDKSHDSAWQQAVQNDEMNVMAIATDAGANIDMLKYIASNVANQKVMAGNGY